MSKTNTPAELNLANTSKSDTIRTFAAAGASVQEGSYRATVSNVKQFAAHGERIGINFTTNSGKFDGEKERIGFEFTIRGGGFDGEKVTLLTVPKLTERSKLTDVIESILGRELTEKELHGDFDLENLIGMECNIYLSRDANNKVGAVSYVSKTAFAPVQVGDVLPYGIVKDGTQFRYWGNLFENFVDAVSYAERGGKRPAEARAKMFAESEAKIFAELAPEISGISNAPAKRFSDKVVGTTVILVIVFTLYWLFFSGSGSNDSDSSKVPPVSAVQVIPASAGVAKINVPSAHTPPLPLENPTPRSAEIGIRCTMPNGVVIEQKLASECPSDALHGETLSGRTLDKVRREPAQPTAALRNSRDDYSTGTTSRSGKSSVASDAVDQAYSLCSLIGSDAISCDVDVSMFKANSIKASFAVPMSQGRKVCLLVLNIAVQQHFTALSQNGWRLKVSNPESVSPIAECEFR